MRGKIARALRTFSILYIFTTSAHATQILGANECDAGRIYGRVERRKVSAINAKYMCAQEIFRLVSVREN